MKLKTLGSVTKLSLCIVVALLVFLTVKPATVEAVRRGGNIEGHLLLVRESHDPSGGFERVYEHLNSEHPASGHYFSAGPEWSSAIKTAIEIKHHLGSINDGLYMQLPPGTIVPEWIWQQWDAEGYTPVQEFKRFDKNRGELWDPVPVAQWHSSFDKDKIFGRNGQGNIDTSPFRDIVGHWAQEAIERMITEGVINGYPDGTFKPDNTISRAEYIALVRRIKAASTTGRSTGFDDIAQHWAKDEIQALEAKGWLVASEHSNRLQPDEGMPRQEMARLVVRSADLSLIQGNTSFNDNDSIPAGFRPFVNTSVERTLIQGYPDGNFRPDGSLTRAEAATMLVRLLDLK